MTEIYGIHKRLQWVVRDLMAVNNLSYQQFSDAVGRDVKEVMDFLNLSAIPDTSFLEKMEEMYGINAQWVFSGEGALYLIKERPPGERMDDSESDLPAGPIGDNVETASAGETAFLETTTRILRSEHQHADSLATIIKSYREDDKAGDFASKLEREILKTEERIKALEKELAAGREGR